ncbi:MAG TPA: helix-turn-helix domain-containing protein [Streptosporangiaceae bacterium]|nr:helix-turn-helix domain-containing protein [Streptosporangiaceae bacterium]
MTARCRRPQRRWGVHPNTVRYRVGRFEQATGCSLRHTESLVEAWWALRRHRAR